MRFTILIAAFIGLHTCHGDTKLWQRDVNFGTAGNWASGQLPCAADSIKFPETMGVVFMQTNSTLKEIQLPKNGALVLDNYIKLAFTDDASVEPDCTGQDQVFRRDAAESWFDPANWASPSGPVAVDTENVPCQFDAAVFPPEKLFYVGIDASTTLNTITFSEKEFTSTNAFSSFLGSDSGQQQFSLTNAPTVQLQNSQCRDLTGCPCGNDAMSSKICGLMEGNCPVLTCSDALTPVGGCCPICGAVLTMEYDSQTFVFQDLKTYLENTYGLGQGVTSSNSARRRRQTGGDVTMYMSKTREEKIQVVLTDSNTGSSSGQSAISLASDIQSDVSAKSDTFGITSISMQSSQKGTGGLSGNVSGGGIAGIILAVIIVICIVSVVVFMMLRRNSFNLKDEEPLHADIEMSHSIPPGFIQEIPNPAYDTAVRGFDNPIYGPTKENLYADPADVRGADPAPPPDPDSKLAYVVEEKGPVTTETHHEDNGDFQAFTNPMAGKQHDESPA